MLHFTQLCSLNQYVLLSHVFGRNQNLVIYDKVDGGSRWNIEDTSNAWVMRNLDQQFLRNYSVDAVFSMKEGQVKAWNTSSRPYPDFEGFLKVKLKGAGNLPFLRRADPQLYGIAIRVPSDHASVQSLQSCNIKLEADALSDLNEPIRSGQAYALHFFGFTSSNSQRFVSIPAAITLTQYSAPVDIKRGNKFRVGGVSFKITSVSSGKIEARDPWSRRSYAKIVLSSSSAGAFEVSATVTNPDIKPCAFGESFTVDHRGNIVKSRAENEGGTAGFMKPSPLLYSFPKASPSSEFVLYSTVNLKNLKLATFRISSTVKAKLENIPLL
jgi:hypothetical protein